MSSLREARWGKQARLTATVVAALLLVVGIVSIPVASGALAGRAPSRVAAVPAVNVTIPAKIACASLVQSDGLHFAGVPDFSRIAEAPTRIESASVVPATSTSPAYCDVKGYIQTQITFELKLPTTTWQGRYLQQGCGGLCGVVNPTSFPTCDAALGGDFSLASTDDGHQASPTDGMWAGRDLQTRIDFGYRAVHVLAVAAKRIQAAYYGQAPKISYFQGCSDGGREGLVEAQRYPTDFTGIVAGAPANYVANAALWQAYYVDANTDSSGNPILTSDKLAPLHAAVVKACDGNDGVIGDGLIGDPRDCHFQAASIQCPAEDQPTCLTRAQVAFVDKLYRGVLTDKGVRLDPRLVPRGSELSWLGFWIPIPPSAGQPAGAPPLYLAKDFGESLAGFVSFPIGQGKPLEDVQVTKTEFLRTVPASLLYNGLNPNLSAFRNAGGKLLLYQGWADTFAPPSSLLDYYAAVTSTMGGQTATQRFARLFTVNGMGHCGGGPTPDSSALVQQMVTWVEHGVAPASILVSDQNAITGELRQRPVFAYPSVPKYIGPDPVANPKAADNPNNFVPAPPAHVHNDRIDWVGSFLVRPR